MEQRSHFIESESLLKSRLVTEEDGSEITYHYYSGSTADYMALQTQWEIHGGHTYRGEEMCHLYDTQHRTVAIFSDGIWVALISTEIVRTLTTPEMLHKYGIKAPPTTVAPKRQYVVELTDEEADQLVNGGHQWWLSRWTEKLVEAIERTQNGNDTSSHK